MSKWGLRGLSIWLVLVVCSGFIGIAASISGNEKIAETTGIIFIGLFGGAIMAALIALAIVIWESSNA